MDLKWGGIWGTSIEVGDGDGIGGSGDEREEVLGKKTAVKDIRAVSKEVFGL